MSDIKWVFLNPPYCYNWKPWFAFFPVKTISGKIIWWKSIYKRKVRIRYDNPYMNPIVDTIQYGTALDLIHNQYQPFERY